MCVMGEGGGVPGGCVPSKPAAVRRLPEHRGVWRLRPGAEGTGPPTVTSLDPKGLRSECGGFVQAAPQLTCRAPNPFLMTMISTVLLDE